MRITVPVLLPVFHPSIGILHRYTGVHNVAVICSLSLFISMATVKSLTSTPGLEGSLLRCQGHIGRSDRQRVRDCFVGWLLNVPATCECISGTDLHRQFTCCHTEIEAADQTFHLTQSQYTDTGPTSPSADPITQGALQGSHWSANFEVTSMTRPRKNPGAGGIRTRDLPLSRRTP